jgi:hypothetical protein
MIELCWLVACAALALAVKLSVQRTTGTGFTSRLKKRK